MASGTGLEYDEVSLRLRLTGQVSRKIGPISYLPQDQPATFCAEHQNIAILGASDCNAPDALWEGDESFLISLLATVDMNHCLLSLRGEDM